MPFNKQLPILQEDLTGCSIACLAWMSGKTYGQVKKTVAELNISVLDPKLWSHTGPVRKIMTEMNFAVSSNERKFVGWEDLPKYALLSVKYHLDKGIPHWHWVVSVRDGEDAFVMDPKKILENKYSN